MARPPPRPLPPLTDRTKSCVLGSPRLELVPYCTFHVRRYHTWMQDPSLLELTCSEALSLEEESQNQQSWRRDEAKLTFIILANEAHSDETSHVHGEVGNTLGPSETPAHTADSAGPSDTAGPSYSAVHSPPDAAGPSSQTTLSDPPNSLSHSHTAPLSRSRTALSRTSLSRNMAGDVNAFFSEVSDDEEDGRESMETATASLTRHQATQPPPPTQWQAEVEVMIAQATEKRRQKKRPPAQCVPLSPILGTLDSVQRLEHSPYSSQSDTQPSYRRRGLASEAVRLLMAHVVETVPNVSRFVAKISDTNEPSIRLFKSLGFQVSPNETESSSPKSSVPMWHTCS